MRMRWLLSVILLLSISALAKSEDVGKLDANWAVPKVGILIVMEEEFNPYVSLLNLKEKKSPFDWARRQPVQIYEAMHKGVFYHVMFNGKCPYCNPYYGVDMIQEQGAIPSTLVMLADGFHPDLVISAESTGGWSTSFNVGEIGICANGRTAVFSGRNMSGNGNYGYDLYSYGHYPCATIPNWILEEQYQDCQHCHPFLICPLSSRNSRCP